jgi:hypothetical protein
MVIKNPYEQAAQGMMQAGIGSLSGNKYDGLASMMTTSPAGNNYYHPNFNVVNSTTTEKLRHKNNDASGIMYSISDFVNPNTGNAMSMSQASNAFAPFRESSRFVYPDGSGYEERGGNTYPVQLKGPQTWRINPGNYGEDDQASVDPDDWRTIIKILESGGDPDDYVTTVDFEEEQQPVEKEKGILNNPLRNELLRRMGKSRRKKDLDALRRMDWERIINRHKFNLIPGTGEENPIFGEPYWNI